MLAIHTIEYIEGRRRRKGQRKGLNQIPWPGWVDESDPHGVKALLTDIESGLVRILSLGQSSFHASTIAYGDCGAKAGELPRVESSLVDTQTLTTLLPGGVGSLEPRTAPLPAWAADQIVHRVETYAGTNRRILYNGCSTDTAKVQASIGMNASKIFELAGIGGDSSVSFNSLRHTAARKVLDACGTDAAMAFLGESNYQLGRAKLGMRPSKPVRPRCRAVTTGSQF